METSSSSIDSTSTRHRRRPRQSQIPKQIQRPKQRFYQNRHHDKNRLFLIDMDHPKHFENMIEKNDMRDLHNIIEDIVVCKKSLKNILDSTCKKDDTAQFENSVHNGIQYINKYVSKCEISFMIYPMDT